MKRKLIAIATLFSLSTTLVLPVHAENTIDTAEPMQQGKEYNYTYFQRIDDGDGGWYYDSEHYYSFSPSTTDTYTVEVKGNWQNENTNIEIKGKSGNTVDYGYYNPYLKRTTATGKLTANQRYYIIVCAGGESEIPQVLSTSVNKHVHEYEQQNYEKCMITGYYEGDLDTIEGGFYNWCKVCDNEEEVTFPIPEKVKLSSSKLVYNGKVQKPKVKITCADGSVFTSYSVKYPNSKNPGKYKLKITFTGDYEGTIKVPYSIVPAKPGTPTLKAEKGGFTAKWKKVKGVDGYQIEWSSDKTFFWSDGTKNLKKTTFSVKKYYIKNISAYCRIRTYKVVSGKKIYSALIKASF